MTIEEMRATVAAHDKKVKVAHDKAVSERVATRKSEMISNGFECRTGHTTSSTNHRDWQSDHGETATFIVVKSNCPKINHVSESSSTWLAHTSDDHHDFDDIGVMGWGETETEAWEHATDEFFDT